MRKFADRFCKEARDELLRLAKRNRSWLTIDWVQTLDSTEQFRTLLHESTFFYARLLESKNRAMELCSLFATSMVLADGVKTFVPTKEQCNALAQVELSVSPKDYVQPYPAMVVDLDDACAPFECITVVVQGSYIILCLYSNDGETDITTVVSPHFDTIEVSIHTYEQNVQKHDAAAARGCRIGLNGCMALMHYGCSASPLYPKELESDRRLSRERTERGDRAKERVRTAAMRIGFAQDIVLHTTSSEQRSSCSEGESPAKSVITHWRRGHWAMQPYGPGNSLRKRILRKPVLVNSSLFYGVTSETSVTYRAK